MLFIDRPIGGRLFPPRDAPSLENGGNTVDLFLTDFSLTIVKRGLGSFLLERPFASVLIGNDDDTKFGNRYNSLAFIFTSARFS